MPLPLGRSRPEFLRQCEAREEEEEVLDAVRAPLPALCSELKRGVFACPNLGKASSAWHGSKGLNMPGPNAVGPNMHMHISGGTNCLAWRGVAWRGVAGGDPRGPDAHQAAAHGGAARQGAFPAYGKPALPQPAVSRLFAAHVQTGLRLAEDRRGPHLQSLVLLVPPALPEKQRAAPGPPHPSPADFQGSV